MRRVKRTSSCLLVVASLFLAVALVPTGRRPDPEGRRDGVRRSAAHYGRRQRAHRKLRVPCREQPVHSGRPARCAAGSGRGCARRSDGQDRHACDDRSPRPHRIPARSGRNHGEGVLHARESHRPFGASRLPRGRRGRRHWRSGRSFRSAWRQDELGRRAVAGAGTGHPQCGAVSHGGHGDRLARIGSPRPPLPSGRVVSGHHGGGGSSGRSGLCPA